MKPIFATHLCAVLLLVLSRGEAQLAAPNSTGVAMGHLHYQVSDVAAEKAFWIRLGGTGSSFANGEIVRFPALVVMISEGESNGGSEGSVVNHVAFRVTSLSDIEALGFVLEVNDQYPGIASVYSPSGERVELFDDTRATNIGFTIDPGLIDAVADRHNQPMTGPIATHHMHFYLPETQVDSARQWYVDIFGATPGQRWRYLAADLPGMNLNFSAADAAQAPTKGRRLDHIGFEVRDLEAFCRTLAARGIGFEEPYRRLPSGFALAYISDPWGTRIELTEGLNRL